MLFISFHFNFIYKYEIVFNLFSFFVQQILNSKVLKGKKKKKTHKRGIQSSPSCFNLWHWRLLEIGLNSLTPARHWALTDVSSSISGGWSWRWHRWLGQTLAPFLCFLSDTPLKSLSTSTLHYSASFLGFQRPYFKMSLFVSCALFSKLISCYHNDPFSYQHELKLPILCVKITFCGFRFFLVMGALTLSFLILR